MTELVIYPSVTRQFTMFNLGMYCIPFVIPQLPNDKLRNYTQGSVKKRSVGSWKRNQITAISNGTHFQGSI